MGFNLRRGLTETRQIENLKDTTIISDKNTPQEKINFNYKHVVITGTIPGKTRSSAQFELKKRFPHIICDDHVSRNTDYLITGFGIGQTKIKHATAIGIPIIEAAKLFK